MPGAAASAGTLYLCQNIARNKKMIITGPPEGK
jgi:hypothetical protein